MVKSLVTGSIVLLTCFALNGCGGGSGGGTRKVEPRPISQEKLPPPEAASGASESAVTGGQGR